MGIRFTASLEGVLVKEGGGQRALGRARWDSWCRSMKSKQATGWRAAALLNLHLEDRRSRSRRGCSPLSRPWEAVDILMDVEGPESSRAGGGLALAGYWAGLLLGARLLKEGAETGRRPQPLVEDATGESASV